MLQTLSGQELLVNEARRWARSTRRSGEPAPSQPGAVQAMNAAVAAPAGATLGHVQETASETRGASDISLDAQPLSDAFNAPLPGQLRLNMYVSFSLHCLLLHELVIACMSLGFKLMCDSRCRRCGLISMCPSCHLTILASETALPVIWHGGRFLMPIS